MVVTKPHREGERKMKALFGRKIRNLEELKRLTEQAAREKQTGNRYTIIKEVGLSPKEFKAFSENFFKDWDWLTNEDGGPSKDGLRCTRVKNNETGEAVLVNNEGFSYARYTALEK